MNVSNFECSILFKGDSPVTELPSVARAIVANYRRSQGWGFDADDYLAEIPEGNLTYEAIIWVCRFVSPAPTIRTAIVTGGGDDFMFICDDFEIDKLNDAMSEIEGIESYYWQAREVGPFKSAGSGDWWEQFDAIKDPGGIESPDGEGWQFDDMTNQWFRRLSATQISDDGWKWIGNRWIRYWRSENVRTLN